VQFYSVFCFIQRKKSSPISEGFFKFGFGTLLYFYFFDGLSPKWFKGWCIIGFHFVDKSFKILRNFFGLGFVIDYMGFDDIILLHLNLIFILLFFIIEQPNTLKYTFTSNMKVISDLSDQ
jgi:hypothetical protein